MVTVAWSDQHPYPLCRLTWRPQLLFCLVTLGVALLTGFLFAAVENWAIIDAMLFAAASISTIGYGNDHPTTTAGRLLIVPIGTLGFFSMTYTLVTTQVSIFFFFFLFFFSFLFLIWLDCC